MKSKNLFILLIIMLPFTMTNQLIAQNAIWKDGFLEKKYVYKKEVIKKAIDTLLPLTPLPIAYGREKINNEMFFYDGYGDKNGRFKSFINAPKINGVEIPEGGVAITRRIADNNGSITVGFKTADNNKDIPLLLHKKLLEYILIFNKSVLTK